MKLSRILAGIGLLVSLSFGAASQAQAITLEDFDAGTPQQRSQFVRSVLHQVHSIYTSKPSTKHKATCLVNLHKTVSAAGTSTLITKIYNELDLARAKPVDGFHGQPFLQPVEILAHFIRRARIIAGDLGDMIPIAIMRTERDHGVMGSASA